MTHHSREQTQRILYGGRWWLPPYSILGTFSRDSQGGVPKLSWFGLPGLWEFITPCSDFRLGWGLKKPCNSPWELSNDVSHSTCTHRGWVDSQLLVVGSQTANLTPGPSFVHNLCCRCPTGSYKAIFGIYTSRPFHHYKEHLKERCFDPCYRTLSFQESRRTPKSPFWECECHPHTLPKVRLRQLVVLYFRTCMRPINYLKYKKNFDPDAHVFIQSGY
jgi:hypothetical protein